MTIEEKGTAFHKKGYNCSQSVLCALGEYTKLPEETAIRLGAGFSGGMQCGSVCGAVSGGMMAVGCACLDGAVSVEEKTLGAKLTRKLQAEFRAEFGTLMCAEIIKENGHAVCDRCIAVAAAAAERIIRDYKDLV